MASPYFYHCDFCNQVVNADYVRAHVDGHRDDPKWKGSMKLTPVNKDGSPIEYEDKKGGS